ncbi:hypothetical protein [Micromonospora sp. NPDC005806]|uniref:hypothetical protein n=1 Tax=Micromonospora sp. NPDC005806 TaxID=3364234 RepID=UPI0036A73950
MTRRGERLTRVALRLGLLLGGLIAAWGAHEIATTGSAYAADRPPPGPVGTAVQLVRDTISPRLGFPSPGTGAARRSPPAEAHSPTGESRRPELRTPGHATGQYDERLGTPPSARERTTRPGAHRSGWCGASKPAGDARHQADEPRGGTTPAAAAQSRRPGSGDAPGPAAHPIDRAPALVRQGLHKVSPPRDPAQDPAGPAEDAQDPAGPAEDAQDPAGQAEDAQDPPGQAEDAQDPPGRAKHAPNPPGQAKHALNPPTNPPTAPAAPSAIAGPASAIPPGTAIGPSSRAHPQRAASTANSAPRWRGSPDSPASSQPTRPLQPRPLPSDVAPAPGTPGSGTSGSGTSGVTHGDPADACATGWIPPAQQGRRCLPSSDDVLPSWSPRPGTRPA